MVRSKDQSELEYLRGIVKKLRAQNKHLKKELARSTKRSRQNDDDLEDAIEEELEEVGKELTHIREGEMCPQCKKQMNVVDLTVKILHMCDFCKYRKTFKV